MNINGGDNGDWRMVRELGAKNSNVLSFVSNHPRSQNFLERG